MVWTGQAYTGLVAQLKIVELRGGERSGWGAVLDQGTTPVAPGSRLTRPHWTRGPRGPEQSRSPVPVSERRARARCCALRRPAASRRRTARPAAQNGRLHTILTGASPGDLPLAICKEFPWFADASIREIARIERPSPHHLYWPELDIDLAVESLTHPEKYPLVSQVPPSRRSQPTKPQRKPAQNRATRRRLRG